MRVGNPIALCAAGLLLLSGALRAGEKKLMHCFAYTPIETATEADWEAFYKATDGLTKKIPGLSKVWYGKLRQNITVYNLPADARKKLNTGEKSVTTDVTQRVRAHGVCMEMADEGTLKTYADHPAHKEWEAAYSKVRVPGTTTFDILGK